MSSLGFKIKETECFERLHGNKIWTCTWCCDITDQCQITVNQQNEFNTDIMSILRSQWDELMTVCCVCLYLFDAFAGTLDLHSLTAALITFTSVTLQLTAMPTEQLHTHTHTDECLHHNYTHTHTHTRVSAS